MKFSLAFESPAFGLFCERRCEQFLAGSVTCTYRVILL